MSETMKERAERAIEEKVFPGCVVGVVRANGRREVLPFGRLTYDGASPGVRENTLYDLASVTKSIPTASLAALFVAEGKLQLKDPVKKYIPELQNDFDASIENLLRYEVRGVRMSTLDFPTFEQVRTHVLEQGFQGPPSLSEYTNFPALLLGIILERISGEVLPALAHKYFFSPLAMNDTTFFPAPRSSSEVGPHDDRVAPTEVVEGKEIRGIVHDESARMFAAKRRAVGHAGLFSTAPDLLNFLEALLQGKFPIIVEFAREGLGWQREGDILGSHPNAGTFGKTGFTGTSVVVDPVSGVAFTILSNRTYPKRPENSDAMNSFRADVADLIRSS